MGVASGKKMAYFFLTVIKVSLNRPLGKIGDFKFDLPFVNSSLSYYYLLCPQIFWGLRPRTPLRNGGRKSFRLIRGTPRQFSYNPKQSPVIKVKYGL